MEREELIQSARKLYDSKWPNDALKKALEEIFPELKESEDERIRKALLRCCDDWDKGQFGCMKKEDIASIRAYLEKQKEQKIARWKSLGECTDIPDGHYVVGWFSFGDVRLGIMWNGLFVGPNGNRAEQPKEVFYIPNADEEFVYAAQKPAEWSEEDRITIERIVETIQDYAMETGQIDEVTCVTKEPLISYIRFLRSLRPQPKQEWSEEDERMLVGIIERGSAQIPPHEPALREEQMAWLMNRLKSLRPQPHWKPSEEQMEALMLAIDGKCPPTSYMSRRLEDLYEGLANTYKVECKLEN